METLNKIIKVEEEYDVWTYYVSINEIIIEYDYCIGTSDNRN